MKINVLKNEKHELEFEVLDSDISLIQLLAARLSNLPDVEFAAAKVDHPLVGKPTILIKTKKKAPVDLVVSELERIKEELKKFKSGFRDALKK